jgi:hypothetical protein
MAAREGVFAKAGLGHNRRARYRQSWGAQAQPVLVHCLTPATGANTLVGGRRSRHYREMIRRKGGHAATESIYDRIAGAATHGGVGLLPGGQVLPDEPTRGDDELRWVDGGADGVNSFVAQAMPDDTTASRVAAAIRELIANDSNQAAITALHQVAEAAKTTSFVDELP